MAYHDASHISRRCDSRGRGRSDRDASRDCGRSDAGRDRARSPLSVNLTTKTVRLHNITFAAMGPLLLIVTLRVVRPLGAIPGEKNPVFLLLLLNVKLTLTVLMMIVVWTHFGLWLGRPASHIYISSFVYISEP